ncbi:hypothetical protein ABU162_11130 [Paenibacillus thiaminolyticus]|uniref:hypothetical protein n=1 Tax=Paenibacillus thiaminolyticus TaxID=49283 RepID=UPI0035A5D3E5
MLPRNTFTTIQEVMAYLGLIRLEAKSEYDLTLTVMGRSGYYKQVRPYIYTLEKTTYDQLDTSDACGSIICSLSLDRQEHFVFERVKMAPRNYSGAAYQFHPADGRLAFLSFHCLAVRYGNGTAAANRVCGSCIGGIGLRRLPFTFTQWAAVLLIIGDHAFFSA